MGILLPNLVPKVAQKLLSLLRVAEHLPKVGHQAVQILLIWAQLQLLHNNIKFILSRFFTSIVYLDEVSHLLVCYQKLDRGVVVGHVLDEVDRMAEDALAALVHALRQRGVKSSKLKFLNASAF